MSVTWMSLTAQLLVEPAERRAAAGYRVAVAATMRTVSRLTSFPDTEILGLGDFVYPGDVCIDAGAG